MTTDDILSMAREAGMPETETEGVFLVNSDDLGRILAAEREECAKECIRRIGLSVPSYDTAIQCADSIRARGKT